MRISELIEHLRGQQEREGDVECTMIATTLPEDVDLKGVSGRLPDVHESTICTTVVRKNTPGWKGKRLLICWQT